MNLTFLSRPARLALACSALTLANGVFALEQITLNTSKLPVYYDLEATLEAVNQSTVSAQTSGAVKAIYFDVNDEVKAGSVLLEIDNTVQLAALQQAIANLEQAKAQNEDAQVLLTRNKKLFEQKTLSQGEYDSTVARANSAAAAVKAAEAGLKQAQEQLAYTQVKAPYSGIVKSRHIEAGELVNPGQPLMTGMAMQPLRAVADMPQRVAQQYNQAKVSVWVNGQELNPEKTTLFPYADNTLHSVRLRAELADNANAFPGQFAKVRVQTGEREAILVPQEAVLRRSELASVYVLHQGEPRLRQVRTGESFNGQVEVLAGLKAGERIVTNALDQLAALNK
ncbi:MAG: efflux RND transporter periplasmic adaptor subunit [Venatoribacter sp.]